MIVNQCFTINTTHHCDDDFDQKTIDFFVENNPLKCPTFDHRITTDTLDAVNLFPISKSGELSIICLIYIEKTDEFIRVMGGPIEKPPPVSEFVYWIVR